MSKQKPSLAIRGVYAALATPRRNNSTEIDSAAFFDYQDAIVRAGVDGLVIFGSTGEFVHFDVTERMHALGLLIKRSRVPVLVNVSHSTLDGTLALADSAIHAGAAGLLVMPPYFYHYSEAQLLAFFEQFAELANGSTRLFLYNLPFYTNPIPYGVIESLLLSGRYAGIKDSSGERNLFDQLTKLHSTHPFTWFAGNECLYLEARSGGADGTVSGVAGAIPELMVAMDRAISSGAVDQATHLNDLLTEFLVWVNKFPATIAIKQAAVVRGRKLDHSAFRFDETTRNELKAFHGWLEEWLPRMLAECADSMALKV